MSEFDTLYSLAEVSIAMAGFAAIVVVFRRRDRGGWHPADADRFNGMLLHAMAAAFFCFLPTALWIFFTAPGRIWAIGSVAMALQVLAHAWTIFRLPTSDGWVRVFLVLPLLVVALQVMNVLGIGYSAEFRPYLAGVLWHLFQAGLLFVMLIWVRESDLADPDLAG